MIPNMDVWELYQEIRSFYEMSILMLTAKRETAEKLKGFAMGTDDYLAKSFEPLELVARVKALLKRYQISISKILKVGNASLKRKTYEMKVQTEGVHVKRLRSRFGLSSVGFQIQTVRGLGYRLEETLS